jgi:hypothetical protein
MDETKDPNHLFKVNLIKGTAALRILLSKRRPAQDQSDSSISKRPQPRPLVKGPRRGNEIIPVKRKALINFYDMGQILEDGEYVDIDFKTLNVDFVAGNNLADPPGHATGTYGSTQANELRDLLLEVPIDQFEAKYKKLGYEEAEKYGVDVWVNNETIFPVARNESRTTLDGSPIEDSKWTPQGLKLDAVPNDIEFITGIGFEPFSSNLAAYKITEEPSYEADPVTTFKLAKKANVFLVPMVVNTGGQALTFVGTSEEPRQTLFSAYSPVSRSVWLNVTDPSIPNPMFAIMSLIADLDTIDPGLKALILDYMIDLVPNKSYLTEKDTSTTTVIDWTISEVSPSGFPMFDWVFARFNNNVDDGLPMAQLFTPSDEDIFGSGDRIMGQLVGVIKQSNKAYYFWLDSNDGPTGFRASWNFFTS